METPPRERKGEKKKQHSKSKGGGSYNSMGLQSSFALSLLFARLVGSPALYLCFSLYVLGVCLSSF